MIHKVLKDSSEKSIYLIPEDSDDLFVLRRIIRSNDIVISDTSRVIKFDNEYSRPDRERVKIRVSLKVEQINLDTAIDRIRIRGIIVESNNTLVQKGTYHSIIIQIGDPFVIVKHKGWKDLELKLIKSNAINTFILIGIDTKEAAISKITGTHIQILPNIYSGQSGKYYNTNQKNNPKIDQFYENIFHSLKEITNNISSYTIIIFGPGETKKKFYNYLITKQLYKKENLLVSDGVDVAGEDGILVFLRSSSIKESMSSSKMYIVSTLLDKIMEYVSKGEEKYAMGMKEVLSAVELNAVEAIMFSNSIITTSNEENLIELLNQAEFLGAKVFAVDSSTDIGLRVTSLGGIIALLRYQIR